MHGRLFVVFSLFFVIQLLLFFFVGRKGVDGFSIIVVGLSAGWLTV